MTSPLFILAVVAIGATLGLGSTYLVVREGWRPGRVEAGPWHIWPREGALDADPYARSRIARLGDLPLGLGEGLTFHATADDEGRPLNGLCRYRIEGTLPVARAWTLTLTLPDGHLHPNPAERYGVASGEALRDVQGRVSIAIGADAMPGDWVPAPRQGGFAVTLRLFDTPVAAVSGSLSAASLPGIRREACR